MNWEQDFLRNLVHVSDFNRVPFVGQERLLEESPNGDAEQSTSHHTVPTIESNITTISKCDNQNSILTKTERPKTDETELPLDEAFITEEKNRICNLTHSPPNSETKTERSKIDKSEVEALGMEDKNRIYDYAHSSPNSTAQTELSKIVESESLLDETFLMEDENSVFDCTQFFPNSVTETEGSLEAETSGMEDKNRISDCVHASPNSTKETERSKTAESESLLDDAFLAEDKNCIFDCTQSLPNSAIEKETKIEESQSLLNEDLVMEDKNLISEYLHSPPNSMNMNYLVTETLEKIQNPNGATLQQIKKYLSSHFNIDVSTMDSDIKQFIRIAVLNGYLAKRDKFRYCLASQGIPQKKTRARNSVKTITYQKTKKKIH